MSILTCDRCRATLIVDADAARVGGDVAAHLDSCGECGTFARALRAGEQAWLDEDAAAFRDGVLARTSEADALASELRDLAEMDPGPGFTGRVLRRTSQRPAVDRWRAHSAAAWRALVSRPRFAWEAAYVVTLVLVLAVGNPLSAWEWGSQKVTAIAQHPIGRAATSLRQDLEAWRDSLDADTATAAPASGNTTAAAPAADSQSAFDAAWQAASTWVRTLLALVVDAFIDLWQRAAAWITGGSTNDEPAPRTEPRGDAARSPR